MDGKRPDLSELLPDLEEQRQETAVRSEREQSAFRERVLRAQAVDMARAFFSGQHGLGLPEGAVEIGEAERWIASSSIDNELPFPSASPVEEAVPLQVLRVPVEMTYQGREVSWQFEVDSRYEYGNEFESRSTKQVTVLNSHGERILRGKMMENDFRYDHDNRQNNYVLQSAVMTKDGIGTRSGLLSYINSQLAVDIATPAVVAGEQTAQIDGVDL